MPATTQVSRAATHLVLLSVFTGVCIWTVPTAAQLPQERISEARVTPTVKAIRRASPAVVNIHGQKTVRDTAAGMAGHPPTAATEPGMPLTADPLATGWLGCPPAMGRAAPAYTPDGILPDGSPTPHATQHGAAEHRRPSRTPTPAPTTTPAGICFATDSRGDAPSATTALPRGLPYYTDGPAHTLRVAMVPRCPAAAGGG